MEILHSDAVFRVPPGATPDYTTDNPLLRLLSLVERVQLAASRESYLGDSLQYLFPHDWLELYGPAGADADKLDPRNQDIKTDFQKQNVKSFHTADAHLVRGWASSGAWTGPFVRLSYRGGPDSQLSDRAHHSLGARIKAFVRMNGREGVVDVPYNEASDRYEVEMWGHPAAGLRDTLEPRARAAFDRGELVARPDLVQGSPSDFTREALNERFTFDVAPGSAMHPVLPLHVEVAWSDEAGQVWDSNGGANHHYEFGMILRGWESYLGVGVSPNPHGGVGFLEYRNLLSNYGRYSGTGELGREVRPWNFDAYGKKGHTGYEPFFSVDYMDMHVLNPGCGIGLHRHRDNQEVFLMVEGRGYMVIGDWVQRPNRDRCLEVRTLKAGHMAMLKGGNLHGLMNTTDVDISLFMFGGYD